MTRIVNHIGEDVEFTCQQCGGHQLEEVMENVVVASELNYVREGDVEYGEQTNEDGEVVAYQCMECGFKLPCDNNSEALYDYLVGQSKEKKLMVTVVLSKTFDFEDYNDDDSVEVIQKKIKDYACGLVFPAMLVECEELDPMIHNCSRSELIE